MKTSFALISLVFAASASFALAEDKAPGPNFEKHKAERLTELDERIQKLQEHRSCVAAAANGSIPLLVIGLAISVPLIVAGAALIMALLTRLPALVWAGAGLLGWIAGEVDRIHPSDPALKIPHMGWNQIFKKNQSSLMKNIPQSTEFYFVHSYHVKVRNQSDLLNETEYDYIFTSAIERENIFGVQYHPEKSHDAGAQLIKNFTEL